MNIVKNIHKLDTIIDDQAKEKLEKGASLHKRMSNITFKILDVDDKSITVRVTQEKHLSENYADKKTLVERTRELFEKFLPGFKIHPQAIPYVANTITDIDASWIQKQMDKHGVSMADLVEDTGLDKTNLSAWVNDQRVMSQPTKAMFFYYFKSKKSA